MARKHHSSTQRYVRRALEQRQWIEDHGGSLSAYIARYGAADDPNRYGHGGAAIFEADMDALRKYERLAGIGGGS